MYTYAYNHTAYRRVVSFIRLAMTHEQRSRSTEIPRYKPKQRNIRSSDNIRTDSSYPTTDTGTVAGPYRGAEPEHISSTPLYTNLLKNNSIPHYTVLGYSKSVVKATHIHRNTIVPTITITNNTNSSTTLNKSNTLTYVRKDGTPVTIGNSTSALSLNEDAVQHTTDSKDNRDSVVTIEQLTGQPTQLSDHTEPMISVGVLTDEALKIRFKRYGLSLV